MTFVDGLGVGDVHDVALRDRRRLSEDGVLIVVATLAGSNGRGALTAAPELIARGFGDGADALLDELRDEAERVLERAARRRRHRDQAAAGARARRARRHRLRPHAPPADDPAGAGGGMSIGATSPTWADVLEECAAEPATARRLIGQLRACEISALAFCRLLERWARGDAQPSTPGERQAALRRAADRVETALDRPRGAAEALPARARGRGARRAVVVRRPRRRRAARLGAGAHAAPACACRRSASRRRTSSSPCSCARSRASRAAARSRRRPTARRSGPGLFDLRDNLLGQALEDLRVLASS